MRIIAFEDKILELKLVDSSDLFAERHRRKSPWFAAQLEVCLLKVSLHSKRCSPFLKTPLRELPVERT